MPRRRVTLWAGRTDSVCREADLEVTGLAGGGKGASEALSMNREEEEWPCVGRSRLLELGWCLECMQWVP